jgi:glycolate oxidase iron-sulfur subunit
VTYQDACHLVHGQQIREQPRALIRRTPGVEFIELPHADRCCGAAGVYNLTHPQMSQEILEEKLAALASTGCSAVVVTNPGCHMQLGAGIALRGMSVRVMHLAELLDAPGVSAASS